MKTAWLSQLKQSVRPTVQCLVSARALTSSLMINASVTGTNAAIDRSIAHIIIKLNALIGNNVGNVGGIDNISRNKHINSAQSQPVSFKTYSTPHSRIRREDLQVAGAS